MKRNVFNEWTTPIRLSDKINSSYSDFSPSVDKEGNLYFCKKMYDYISNGFAVSKSLTDYLYIYKAYNYSYSPLQYWYERKLRSKLRRINRVFST